MCSVARLFITRLQCRVTFYDPISAPTQTLLILGAFHYSTLAEWGSWRNYENSNFGLSQQDPQPFFFFATRLLWNNTLLEILVETKKNCF